MLTSERQRDPISIEMRKQGGEPLRQVQIRFSGPAFSFMAIDVAHFHMASGTTKRTDWIARRRACGGAIAKSAVGNLVCFLAPLLATSE